MKWSEMFTSSVGKKWVMAFTGLFLILFLVAVNYRHLRMGPEASPLEAAASEEELELVYSENNAW